MKKRKTITLNPHEIQSGLSRVRHAELLIVQLAADHNGRNTWLLNYGTGAEAANLRETYNERNREGFTPVDMNWDNKTQSLTLTK